MPPRMTPSEELVLQLCTKSFFSLWSYARPRGKKGKELCDVLVVCDPNVVIFSVKEVHAKTGGSTATNWDRWRREAIDASVKQIAGAERWLDGASHVVRADGQPGLPLPDLSARRVHRIAVALGSGGEIPISGSATPRGRVHVFDERALDVLMQELDTITDFTAYLQAKEALLTRTMVLSEGEEGLLAVYLLANRRFENMPDSMVIEGNHWESFAKSEAYQAKQRADKASRVFDHLIHQFGHFALAGTLEMGATLSDTERIARVMARESRFQRRVLGKCFMDFLAKSGQDPRGLARITRSDSGVVYVFLAAPRDIPRELRIQDLERRCLVARGLHRDSTTVIGVATQRLDGKEWVSLDGCCVASPTWTQEMQEEFDEIQRQCRYFVDAKWTKGTEDEYPRDQ